MNIIIHYEKKEPSVKQKEARIRFGKAILRLVREAEEQAIEKKRQSK